MKKYLKNVKKKKMKKVNYKLSLTEQEAEFLEDCLEKGFTSIAWTIIQEANKRGDFEKI